MQGLWIFLGALAGVLLIAGGAFLVIRRQIRRFARRNFGAPDLSGLIQAALQYRQEGRLVQKRFCLHYAYLLPRDRGATVAGSCPHCGAPFTSAAQTNCPYCGSLVANVLGNTWEFTDLYEK